MPDTKVIPRGARMQFKFAAESQRLALAPLYICTCGPLPGKGIQAISRYCEWDLARPRPVATAQSGSSA